MKKLQKQYLFLADHEIESVEQLQETMQKLSGQKKSISNEKTRMYRARKKSESLFEIVSQMDELKDCEDAYANGDTFFETEHEAWMGYEDSLKTQGYSYEEVKQLQEHYHSEIARLRTAEKEVAVQIRTAKMIENNLAEQKREKVEIKEKKWEKVR